MDEWRQKPKHLETYQNEEDDEFSKDSREEVQADENLRSGDETCSGYQNTLGTWWLISEDSREEVQADKKTCSGYQNTFHVRAEEVRRTIVEWRQRNNCDRPMFGTAAVVYISNKKEQTRAPIPHNLSYRALVSQSTVPCSRRLLCSKCLAVHSSHRLHIVFFTPLCCITLLFAHVDALVSCSG